ncbi:MAG: 50S ribosomal protein L23 [Candidatus Portnoybacteria bacterium]|nr:50S ribosomal protein L23 [Candidatus Portnoybacteria bacterium]
MAIFNFLKKNQPQSKPKSTQKPVKPAIRKNEPTATIDRQVKKAQPKRKDSAASKLLKAPHISEKATNLSEEGKYVFKVYKNANKSEIKKTISNFYGVVVKDVNIINIRTKIKLLRGKRGEKSGYKKAIVTLEKGHKIEILPH